MKCLHSIVFAIALFLVSEFLLPLVHAADLAAPIGMAAASAEVEKPRKGWLAPILAEEVKWTDVAQVGVAIIGFILVLLQLGKLKETLAGDAYTSLYDQYVDVCKIFLKKPYLRPYFYPQPGVVKREPASEETLAEIEIVAELMTGLLEHAALQQDSIPKAIYEQCWLEFTIDRFKSPSLIAYWHQNKQWYAGDFQIMVEDILKGKKPKIKGWRNLWFYFERRRMRAEGASRAAP